MIKRGILVAIFLVLTLALVGWGKSKLQYGEAVPDSVEIVTLKKIVENPHEYKDKEVVLEGNYGTYCCASDFVYKEGLEAVEVYPKGFPVPKLDRGKPIMVYGVVKIIERKEESVEGEEKEEDHHEILIEAKGVEVK